MEEKQEKRMSNRSPLINLETRQSKNNAKRAEFLFDNPLFVTILKKLKPNNESRPLLQA